jgi:nicotinamidase-related amidase
MTNEAFYDQEIAPALAALAERCRERGLSIIAMVEWEPGEGGRTVSIQPGSSFGIRLAEAAMQANGNVDSLMIAVARHAKEHGHSSLVLSILERKP